MIHPIYTELTECRDCYKCVRACPVKAIQVKDGNAVIIFSVKHYAWNPISDGISSVAAVPEKVWNKSTHSLGNGWCKMSFSCEMRDGVRVYDSEEQVVEVEVTVEENLEVSTTPRHELVTENEAEKESVITRVRKFLPTWLGGESE